jgi:UPF0716 protein FxsA
MFARIFLLFVTVPVLELCIFLVLGQRIGIPMTLATIVLTAVVGAYLTKSQGLKAISRYQESLAQGRLPHEAIIDSLLILIAGALLLTPGFLTDSIGFSLLVPSVRGYIRGWVEKSLQDRINLVGQNMGAPINNSQGTKSREPQVITVETEVIEITRDRSKA